MACVPGNFGWFAEIKSICATKLNPLPVNIFLVINLGDEFVLNAQRKDERHKRYGAG